MEAIFLKRAFGIGKGWEYESTKYVGYAPFLQTKPMTILTPQLSLIFEHAYECEIASETTGRENRKFFYPGATAEGGRDGLMVNVTPYKGDPWLGIFAFGEVTPKGITGIFSTPNSERLCVVAQGNAFIVSVDDPGTWESVRAIPVIDVRCIIKHEIIVFAAA